MSLRASVARIAGVVSAVTVIVAAPFGVQSYADNRYAAKEDVKQQVMQIKDSISDLHRARLEDEIFKLELIPKGKRTSAESALLDRYKSQVKEIDAKRGVSR